jgi:hypothetical protein
LDPLSATAPRSSGLSVVVVLTTITRAHQLPCTTYRELRDSTATDLATTNSSGIVSLTVINLDVVFTTL